MWCGMKEIDKLTAWDKGMNVCQNSYVPFLKYKGIELSEEDVVGFIENELDCLFEDENRFVSELIEDGVLTEQSKGKVWAGNNVYDIVNDYLNNPANHENILSHMDDMIFAMQTPERLEEMKNDANEIYGDNLETDFRNTACSALAKYCLENEGNMQKLILGQWGETAYDDIIENSKKSYSYGLRHELEYFFDDNLTTDEMDELCKEYSIKTEMSYLVYAQNNEYEECYDKQQMAKAFENFTKKYEGLSVVICSVNGTEYTGGLTKDDLKKVMKQFNVEKEKQMQR